MSPGGISRNSPPPPLIPSSQPLKLCCEPCPGWGGGRLPTVRPCTRRQDRKGLPTLPHALPQTKRPHLLQTPQQDRTEEGRKEGVGGRGCAAARTRSRRGRADRGRKKNGHQGQGLSSSTDGQVSSRHGGRAVLKVGGAGGSGRPPTTAAAEACAGSWTARRASRQDSTQGREIEFRSVLGATVDRRQRQSLALGSCGKLGRKEKSTRDTYRVPQWPRMQLGD